MYASDIYDCNSVTCFDLERPYISYKLPVIRNNIPNINIGPVLKTRADQITIYQPSSQTTDYFQKKNDNQFSISLEEKLST